MKKSLILIGLALLLTACQFSPLTQPTATPSATPEPTSTQTPLPTATATATVAPTDTTEPSTAGTVVFSFPATATPIPGCPADDLIERLNPLVPYDTFTLGYNRYYGANLLFFWIMDPNLSPTASEAELETYFDQAVRDAIELAHILNQADPCIAADFDYFNPVVVDSNYNGWFSGLLAVNALPDSAELTEADIANAKQAIMTDDYGYWQRDFVPEVQEIPAESCTWSEVKEYVSRHFFDDPQNTYMLVADNNGISFTIQFQSALKGDEWVVYLNTAREIACLQPAVDNIIIYLVDANGFVVYMESVPVSY